MCHTVLKVAFWYPKCWSVKPGFETRLEFTLDRPWRRDGGGFLRGRRHFLVLHCRQPLKFVPLPFGSGRRAVAAYADAATAGLTAVEGHHVRHHATVHRDVTQVGVLAHRRVAVTGVLAGHWHAVLLRCRQRRETFQRRFLEFTRTTRKTLRH